jgi:hypothetical protein
MKTYFKRRRTRIKGPLGYHPRRFRNRFLETPKPVSSRDQRPVDDFVHDSQEEMQYAMHLEERQRRGEIKLIEKQVKFELRVNGRLICNHYVDFRVTMADDSLELHEYKGVWSNIFIFKIRLLRATFLAEHPEVKYRLMVLNHGKFGEIK